MKKEIERKFLVKGDFKSTANSYIKIFQAYLSVEPGHSVRVRVLGNNGFITIKGDSDPSGLTRNEWEYEIPVSDARELLGICSGGFIQKTRYYIEFKGHTFEVDEFSGENEGLVIAELELNREDEVFVVPSWLGKEVTGDQKYYNIMLLKHPFKSW
jgi:CYTH domain-containing protein